MVSSILKILLLSQNLYQKAFSKPRKRALANYTKDYFCPFCGVKYGHVSPRRVWIALCPCGRKDLVD